ncbi:MAG: hypothetical protein ABII90_01620 [Bacteroidota bacterium]
MKGFELNTLEFTKYQSRQMYDILAEIHSLLEDKTSCNNVKLSIYERSWMQGIDSLLKEIRKVVVFQ